MIANYKKINLTKLVENIAFSQVYLLSNSSPYEHSLRVSLISNLISREMNLEKIQRIDLYHASLLHDIGAFSNEVSLLLEFNCRKEMNLENHAYNGYELFRDVPFFETTAYIIKEHHNENTTNLLSRIIFFADEIEIQIRSNNFTKPKEVQAKAVSLFKDKRTFKEVLDAFIAVSRNDAFLFLLKDLNELKKENSNLVGDRFEILSSEELNSFAKSIAKNLVDAKSEFTKLHSIDVTYTAVSIAKAMGFSPMDCQKIETAGFLHDTGKLFVPLSILEKPDKLSGNEWLTMKSHAYYTYSFLNSLGIDKEIVDIASFHHEYLDGSGYPFGLEENNLSIFQRIMTVSDVYAALRQQRPYRTDRLKHDEAIEILEKMAKNGKIDKQVVKSIPYNLLMLWEY
jgi:HD-GYP domain-containing protein (c-di-GMP phosphodiesterase class II)